MLAALLVGCGAERQEEGAWRSAEYVMDLRVNGEGAVRYWAGTRRSRMSKDDTGARSAGPMIGLEQAGSARTHLRGRGSWFKSLREFHLAVSHEEWHICQYASLRRIEGTKWKYEQGGMIGGFRVPLPSALVADASEDDVPVVRVVMEITVEGAVIAGNSGGSEVERLVWSYPASRSRPTEYRHCVDFFSDQDFEEFSLTESDMAGQGRSALRPMNGLGWSPSGGDWGELLTDARRGGNAGPRGRMYRGALRGIADGSDPCIVELSLVERDEVPGASGQAVRTLCGEDGTFTVPVLQAGTYEVVAHFRNYSLTLGRVALDPQVGTSAGLEFSLPATQLVVEVADKQGRPVVGRRVYVRRAAGGEHVLRVERLPATDEAGRVHLRHLGEAAYLCGSLVDGARVLEYQVDVRAATAATAALVVAKCGFVDVQVVRDGGIPAPAVLMIQSVAGDVQEVFDTSAKGAYRLYVAPGEWMLGLYERPSKFDMGLRFRMGSSRIRVEEGATVVFARTLPQ